MKIALYKTNYSDRHVLEADEWIENKPEDYLRISEIVDIDFVMLPKSETLSKELAMIDAQIEELQSDFGSRISHLQAKKQELLAIGHDDEQ